MIEGLKPYAEYKESGSPWLGAVPEHWEVISLKHWVRINRAVLPHAPDAWYVPESVKTGYEISFTRYFYQPNRCGRWRRFARTSSRSRHRPKGCWRRFWAREARHE